MSRNPVYTPWLILLLLFVGCQFASPTQIASAQQAPVNQAQDKQDGEPASDAQTADEPTSIDGKTDKKTDDVATSEDVDKGKAEKDAEEGVIKAYFLSTAEHQIASRPEEWTSELRVEAAVPHGTSVQQGEVIVKFRSRKFDQAIEDQEHSVTTARLALEKAELELHNLRKSKRMAVADAERAEHHATEDLKRFVTTERDQRTEQLEYNTKSAEDFLAYEEEELKQLTKMYEADDLTEETEEIVLRRTRDDVARSRHRLMVAQQSMEKGFEVELPRSQERLELALKKTKLELEKTSALSEAELAEKEIGLEKLRRDFSRAEERLARLNADRPCLTLKTPISGLVYHGKQRFGKWSDPSQMANQLRPGGTCKPHQVLMTVVKPTVGQVMGIMDEADFTLVGENRSGKLVISAYPKLECEATVVEISTIPVAPGKFLVTMQPRLPDDVDRLVPGMTCEVSFEESE